MQNNNTLENDPFYLRGVLVTPSDPLGGYSINYYLCAYNWPKNDLSGPMNSNLSFFVSPEDPQKIIFEAPNLNFPGIIEPTNWELKILPIYIGQNSNINKVELRNSNNHAIKKTGIINNQAPVRTDEPNGAIFLMNQCRGFVLNVPSIPNTFFVGIAVLAAPGTSKFLDTFIVDTNNPTTLCAQYYPDPQNNSNVVAMGGLVSTPSQYSTVYMQGYNQPNLIGTFNYSLPKGSL